MTKQTDHDLLVAHSVKIDNLCGLVRNHVAKFDEYILTTDTRCESRRDDIYKTISDSVGDTMPKDMLKWLLGFLILILIGLASAIGINQVKIQANHGHYIETINQIKENQMAIKRIQRILDLKIAAIPPGPLNGTNGKVRKDAPL